ncbi:MAG: PEGA domain-containing protein [bacterium]|nr:PEGA domain-containing protein [bacterium]
MTLLYRRILYIVFILFFLILTPLVSFYAAGYDFNLKNGSFRRTGILFLESEPKDAEVYLGDKQKYNWLYDLFYKDRIIKTPVKLRNLLPDEYKLTLTKQNYFDYHRDIAIHDGQTLVLNNIMLFKKSYPDVLINKNIIEVKKSNNGKYLAALTQDSLSIINLANNEIKEIPLNAKIDFTGLALGQKIFWAPSDKKILLSAIQPVVFNIDNGNIEAVVNDYVKGEIKSIKWNNFSDNELFIQLAGIIYKLDIITKSLNIWHSDGVDNDFLIKDNHLFYLEKNAESSTLIVYDNGSKSIKNRIELPYINLYQISNENDKIFLHDSDHDILYIIDPWSILPLRDSLNNVKEYTAISDSKVLYWNNFEIWLFQNGKKNLITRISSPISTAIWHPSGDHIIYNSQDNLNVIELKDGEYLSMLRLLSWSDTKSLTLSAKNDFVYFVSPLDEKQGLYKLEIK